MSKTSISRTIPVWLKVSAYFLTIMIAAYVASIVPALDSIFYYFLVTLLLSFLMLRQEGKLLASLGFIPVSALDWKHFFAGLISGIVALSMTAFVTIWLTNGKLKLTGHIDPVYIVILLLIHLWSAFVQEFTYRGYPFQTLLKAYGPWIAQVSVTLPFAIMHLKLNMPITLSQFMMTWLTTGLGSVLYGLCYIKTGKLLLSIGLHMGWNVAQALIPRSMEEPKSVLFTLIKQDHSYHTLKVLLPYICITIVMITIISLIKLKPALHAPVK